MEAAEKDTALSIGEALSLLQAEFPEISISKIRFLEAKGLIAPERTASGFRRFQPEDIERLIAILKMQRDQYLPLKVIREQFGSKEDPKRAPRRPRGEHHRSRPDQPRLGIDDESSESAQSSAAEGASAAASRPETVVLRIVQPEALGGEPEGPPDQSREVEIEDALEAAPTLALEEPSSSSEATEIVSVPDDTIASKEVAVASEAVVAPAVAESIDAAEPEASLVPNDAMNMLVASEAASFGDIGKHWISPPVTPSPDAKVEKSSRNRPDAASGTIRRPSETSRAPAVTASEGAQLPEGLLAGKDFAREAGASQALLGELELYGIIKSQKYQGETVYEARYLELVRVARTLAGIGLTPRHLKSLRVSVEKEFGLIEQLVATQLGGGGARSKRKAREVAKALEEQTENFRTALLGVLIEELFQD